jgi:hypothetical protein
MDQLTQASWEATIDQLSQRDEGLRKHFAQLILMLAKCYDPDTKYKAVVLINTKDSLLTFCAGADEMELVDMLSQAHDTVQAIVLQDAPPKEMFN